MAEEFEDTFEDDLKDILEENKDDVIMVEAVEKITPPVLSMYEKIDVLKKRVEQLDNNYKTTIPEEVRKRNLTKSIDIAILEYDMLKLPNLFIYRDLPNGTYEKWDFYEFQYYP